MSRKQSHSLSENGSSFGSRLPSSFTRGLPGKPFQQHGGSAISFNGASPKTKVPLRYPIGGNPPSMNSVKEDGSLDGSAKPNWDRKYHLNSTQVRSSGLKYSLQVSRELSSIDKINDSSSKSIVVSGKSHLRIYSFSEDRRELECTVDLLSEDQKGPSSRISNKTSTISDVKAGFNNHKNYIAICGTSTSVSIYDINKANTLEGPLTTILSKHTRSINSVDFNMAQSSLLISGSQDGCIKVWDLRSSQGRKNKSDLTINSGSDSVRDVKWMPTYDFSPEEQGPSNRGHRFASIHDSGLLLTYDLRQPSQAEKRINAHSGPGLCLCWHPTADYIMTGGRDGKCCLWNTGSRHMHPPSFSGSHHGTTFNASAASSLLTPGFSINSSATSTNAPEVVINTAHPLSKLKFCPSGTSNVLNSVVALSSLGESSDVSVYSLSRVYIPKNILTTASPSSGFVWWDDKLIFNVDKQSMITGWDIEREPTQLDNLPQGKVSWRDIEGDGLLFLGQEKGGYEAEATVPSSTTFSRKPSQSRMSTATINNLFSGNSIRQSSSVSSFPALASRTNSGGNFPDRPSFPRTGASYNNKGSYSQMFGSYNSQLASHHNSIVSMSSSSAATDLDLEVVNSPRMISLDLPQILNSIRSSKMQDLTTKPYRTGLLALRESPVEVFKFLSRELKFSYMRERDYNKIEDNATQSETGQSADDIDIKAHLINRFGLAENNTWTKFIKRNNSTEASEPTPNEFVSGPSQNEESASLPSDQSSNDDPNQSTHLIEKENSGREERNKVKVKQRIQHYIELISMCDHNAETYLYIDDLTNFKIWMMMRDALLWELKQIADTFKLDTDSLYSDYSPIGISDEKDTHAIRKQSMASEYSSFSTSEVDSAAGSQQILKPRGSHVSNISPRTTDISGLKTRVRGDSTNDMAVNESSRTQLLKANIADLREQKTHLGEDADVAIEDEDDGKGESKHESGPTSTTTENIPIMSGSSRKVSFIDNFLTSMRYPKPSHYETEGEGSRHSNSLSTKRSSQPSYSSSFAGLVGRKQVDGSPKLRPKDQYSGASSDPLQDVSNNDAFEAHKKDSDLKLVSQKSKISMLIKDTKKFENAPPWNATRLIRKIFEQSVATGNILLTINIILLFQTTFHVTSTVVVKNALAEFINILHKYELFEIAADLLKYCPWDDILGSGTGQCTVRIYCHNCKKLLVNESSKEKFTEEWKRTGRQEAMKRFGYWYCDLCSRRNTLCALCERPLKKLTMCILSCGHEGHPECFQRWFMDEEMSECPAGCSGQLLQ